MKAIITILIVSLLIQGYILYDKLSFLNFQMNIIGDIASANRDNLYNIIYSHTRLSQKIRKIIAISPEEIKIKWLEKFKEIK